MIAKARAHPNNGATGGEGALPGAQTGGTTVAERDNQAGGRARGGDSAPAELEAVLRTTAATAREPFLVLEADLTLRYANPAFYALTGDAPGEAAGVSLFDLAQGRWDSPALRRLLGEVPRGREVEDLQLEHRLADGDRRTLCISARPLAGHGAFPDKVLVSLEDVTERERLERELIARHEFTEKLIDSLREAVLVLTPELRVHTANQPFYELFAVTAGETRGRHVHELGNRQWDIPELRALLADILGGTATFDDYLVEHEFEGIGWRRMSLNARRLDHLNLILLTIRDLTEVAVARREMDLAAQRFRLLVESSAQAVWETDAQGRVVAECPAWQAYTGQGPEEIAAMGWLEAVHPDDQAHLLARWQEATATQRPFDAEYRLRHAGEGWRWSNARAAPLRDGAGQVVRWVGMNLDVTGRKETEQALQRMAASLEMQVAATTAELREERNFIADVLDNQPAPVLVLDRELRVVTFNRACEEATGVDFASLFGTRGWLELVPPEERAMVAQVDGLLAGEGERFHQYENHWCHRDGSRRLFRWTNGVIRDADGHPQYIVGAAVDVTAERAAEQQAQRHLEEAAWLQRLNTAEALATMVAHEVNQPLTAIGLYAEAAQARLANGPPDPDSVGESLERVVREAHRGAEIIRRLRRLVRRESLEPAPLDLNATVGGACDLFRPRARRMDMAVACELDAARPRVQGVELHIEQVMLNLLGNAVEAMRDAGVEGGRVRVATECLGDRARVSVEDQGPGLGSADLEALFDPLVTSKAYGLGMGLRISRSLVEALDGHLWAEDGGRGAVFRFDLPLAP